MVVLLWWCVEILIMLMGWRSCKRRTAIGCVCCVWMLRMRCWWKLLWWWLRESLGGWILWWMLVWCWVRGRCGWRFWSRGRRRRIWWSRIALMCLVWWWWWNIFCCWCWRWWSWILLVMYMCWWLWIGVCVLVVLVIMFWAVGIRIERRRRRWISWREIVLLSLCVRNILLLWCVCIWEWLIWSLVSCLRRMCWWINFLFWNTSWRDCSKLSAALRSSIVVICMIMWVRRLIGECGSFVFYFLIFF